MSLLIPRLLVCQLPPIAFLSYIAVSGIVPGIAQLSRDIVSFTSW